MEDAVVTVIDLGESRLSLTRDNKKLYVPAPPTEPSITHYTQTSI